MQTRSSILRVFLRCAVAAAFMLAPAARSQDVTWQVAVSGGYALLQMAEVNATLEQTIQTWNAPPYSIPVEPFEAVSSVPVIAAAVTYRYERNMAVMVSGRYWAKELLKSYADADATLDMDRSLRSTEVTVGLLYYVPPLPRGVEFFGGMEVGWVGARAVADTYQAQNVKTGAGVERRVQFDTRATFSKSSFEAGLLGGALIPLAGPLRLRVETGYMLAKVGTMDGSISRIDWTTTEQTVTKFDFSSFRLMAGFSYEW